MRLRNGKVCEEGLDGPTSTSDTSHVLSSAVKTIGSVESTNGPTSSQAQVSLIEGAQPQAKLVDKSIWNERTAKNGPSASNGTPIPVAKKVDEDGRNIFSKSAAVYLSEVMLTPSSRTGGGEGGGEVQNHVAVVSSTTSTSSTSTAATEMAASIPKSTHVPTKDSVVRPHSRTVLLALKVGAWSLVIMYFIIPAIVKLNPWIMSEIAFLHRFRVPFFVDLTKPALIGLNGTYNFQIPSADNVELGAWHILPENLQDRDLTDAQHYTALLKHGEPIIIYFHGNAGTRAVKHRVALYNVLAKAGYHIITIDYRGFGDSTGTPSEEGLIEDGMAVFDWVKKHSGKVPVYIWGHSLGSGVATQVAAKACSRGTLPSGVILDAPFSNIIEAASSHPLAIPFRYMPYFTWVFVESLQYNNIFFANDKHIQDVNVPIMILHAKDDTVVPFSQGKKLHEAALKGKGADTAYLIAFEPEHKYGHDNIWKAADLPRIVRDFMDGKLNS